ncbi:type VI secretion system tip protein TssI/VgrG [Pseudomonas aeruginosa]|uniref:type VI secretion system tip protein TssI/VgrG n=1 Tax=Pseudomonas aeruginosa TaxID=287 RepID=UPI00104A7390|nr:type VI secretion system tip protein TssI/VgrG [Pseudomonas aeruginosa]
MPRPTDSTTSLSLTASALAALFPERLAGEERLNALPGWELLGYSASPLALDGAIATHLTATLHNDADQRPLDGLVAEIRQLPGDASAERYQVLLRPWLWWLTLASNNRVFQNLATSDIVTQVFDQHGFSDYQLQLSGSYQPREYCVQYGESDLAFVSRLLEEDGIFWFFTHAAGKHTLVLADSNDAFPPIPNGPQVAYLGQGIGVRELQGVRSAQYSLQAVSGTYSATDYGWLVPGHWFTLSGHDDDSLNIDWVLTSVTHDASHAHYRNRFEAIPKATAYRPARVTPKPRMHTQTALVVGKAGEEIWTDQYGRIKIQFPWDRDGKNDETSSCWVRVVLPWSGKGFGMQFVPRIGQEVIVTFIDGDPDRPLVTGCVYNGDNALPYALPDNQTQSGIKTNSSKGGGGFNELRFEDKKDAEEVFLQAQKDFNVNVLNDSTASIGHDETLTVQNARTRTVKEGDETVTLEKGKRTVTIQTGSDSLDVKDTRTVTVGADQTHSTGGNYSHKVSGNFELTVDGNLTIKVSGTLALQSGGSLTLKSDADLAAQAGTSLTSKAGTSLTNQAGTSLTNKAGTSLTNDAGVSLTNKAGAEQTVDGGGMLTIKGGLVKVN